MPPMVRPKRDRILRICRNWHAAWAELDVKCRQTSAVEEEVFALRGSARKRARARLATAEKRLDRAYDRIASLTEAVARAQATSYAGIAAKLHVFLTYCTPVVEAKDTPWTWLLAVQRDLERLVEDDASRPPTR